MWIIRSKWVGSSISGVSVLVALAIGVLAFRGVISAEEAYSKVRWCALSFVLGFVLHVFAILEQKAGKNTEQKPEGTTDED
jgi:hypothetical protein